MGWNISVFHGGVRKCFNVRVLKVDYFFRLEG